MPKRRAPEESVTANLLPIMNVMFLLIPALLLAMEFASMAQLPVTVPRIVSLPSDAPSAPLVRPLEFKVTIGSDGFRTAARTGESTIPLQGERHDYAALGAVARALKASHPDEASVTITAEGDIPMSVLVATMDTLRGDRCKMSGWSRGEAPSAECLFWSPTIASGAG